MPSTTECLVSIVSTIGIGIIGGVLGWSIIGMILYGPREIVEFWKWIFQGGWRD